MSVQDVDEGKDSNHCLLVIFKTMRTKFEVIEQRIDTTIKDLQDLWEKMYTEITDIDGVIANMEERIAKIEECGGSQDEL